MRDPLLDKALERLRERFPRASRSWLRRALLRLGDVRRVGPGHYSVEGRPELGDHSPVYYVFRRGRGWVCTCQLTPFAHRRRLCTHIAAVLLYREHARLVERGRELVYVAAAEVECRGRITVDAGEVVGKAPLGEGKGLERYASGRYRIVAASRRSEVVVRCDGRAVHEAEGDRMPLAAAVLLARQLEKGD
jgi:hypothetical protein